MENLAIGANDPSVLGVDEVDAFDVKGHRAARPSVVPTLPMGGAAEDGAVSAREARVGIHKVDGSQVAIEGIVGRLDPILPAIGGVEQGLVGSGNPTV
jgi:hypothetical protein